MSQCTRPAGLAWPLLLPQSLQSQEHCLESIEGKVRVRASNSTEILLHSHLLIHTRYLLALGSFLKCSNLCIRVPLVSLKTAKKIYPIFWIIPWEFLISWAPFNWSFQQHPRPVCSPCGSTWLCRTRSKGKFPKLWSEGSPKKGHTLISVKKNNAFLGSGITQSTSVGISARVVSEVASSLQ